MDLMPSALLITVIGMGLVFIALLLLWGMIELMMWISARFARPEGEEAEEIAEEIAPVEAAPVQAAAPNGRKVRAAAAAVAVARAAAGGTLGRKARVAAAAVAVAMIQQNVDRSLPPRDGSEMVSAWQAVLRSNRLSRQASMYTRKQRGLVR